MGPAAKSYMRKGLLIYDEMLKYLTIYDYKEAISHIWLCHRYLLNFLKLYMKKFDFFLIIVVRYLKVYVVRGKV